MFLANLHDHASASVGRTLNETSASTKRRHYFHLSSSIRLSLLFWFSERPNSFTSRAIWEYYTFLYFLSWWYSPNEDHCSQGNKYLHMSGDFTRKGHEGSLITLSKLLQTRERSRIESQAFLQNLKMKWAIQFRNKFKTTSRIERV
jgi:hypothetical protein